MEGWTDGEQVRWKALLDLFSLMVPCVSLLLEFTGYQLFIYKVEIQMTFHTAYYLDK